MTKRTRRSIPYDHKLFGDSDSAGADTCPDRQGDSELATKDWGINPCRDAVRWVHGTSPLTDPSSVSILRRTRPFTAGSATVDQCRRGACASPACWSLETVKARFGRCVFWTRRASESEFEVESMR